MYFCYRHGVSLCAITRARQPPPGGRGDRGWGGGGRLRSGYKSNLIAADIEIVSGITESCPCFMKKGLRKGKGMVGEGDGRGRHGCIL